MSDLLPVAPELLAAAFAVTIAAATLQGTIGFGFSILSVPILSLLDPRLAPVPQLLVTIPLTLAMAVRERHAIEPRSLVYVLAGKVPGAGVGVLLLKLASPRMLDGLLAGIVLVAVALLARGGPGVPSVTRTGAGSDTDDHLASIAPRTAHRTRLGELVAGVGAGMMGLIASMSGPPLALLYRQDAGATVRANLAAIFVAGSAVTLTARVVSAEIAWSDVIVSLWLLPAVGAGWMVSRWLAGRVEGKALRLAILGVASLAAVGLLGRALL